MRGEEEERRRNRPSLFFFFFSFFPSSDSLSYKLVQEVEVEAEIRIGCFGLDFHFQHIKVFCNLTMSILERRSE